MKRGRDSLLPDEKRKKAFKEFCMALVKGDQVTAKKYMDVIEEVNGKGELWNGFMWGLNGLYEAASRGDERIPFVMAYKRLSAEEIRNIASELRKQEGALFVSERERGVFEANIYALEVVAEAVAKGEIKREQQNKDQNEQPPVIEDTSEEEQD